MNSFITGWTDWICYASTFTLLPEVITLRSDKALKKHLDFPQKEEVFREYLRIPQSELKRDRFKQTRDRRAMVS
tara:strand:+ start:4117 stop:4338 length:222 start_codon:yes stop_codon:yes gene_type:complete